MTAPMAAPLHMPASLDTRALDDFAGAFVGRSGDRVRAVALAWPRVTPLQATQCAATVLALTFAYGLMRLPLQISDSLEQLLNAQQSPSVLAHFVAWSQRAAYLRPMFFAEVKALFDLAHGHYWLVYRGFHALLACAADRAVRACASCAQLGRLCRRDFRADGVHGPPHVSRRSCAKRSPSITTCRWRCCACSP